MTDEQLETIKRRCEAATAGPWEKAWQWYNYDILSKKSQRVAREVPIENAEFISHTRTDVPKLLDEIRRLREDNEKLQQHFDIRHRDFETVFAEYERARELLEWWIDSMKPHSLDREIFGKTRAFLDGEDK